MSWLFPHVDEADLAELGQMLELAALFLAGRGRAFGGVERLPITVEIGDIGAARMGEHRQIEERVALRPDRLRHLLQVDEVEAKARVGAQQPDDVLPQRDEAVRAQGRGKILGQQRGVVVAQLGAQPGEAAHRTARLDRELQDEEQMTFGVAAQHDGRDRVLAFAYVPLPLGEPIEGLEHGAVGAPLERLPLALDLAQGAVDAQAHPGAGRLRQPRRALDRRARRRREFALGAGGSRRERLQAAAPRVARNRAIACGHARGSWGRSLLGFSRMHRCNEI